MTGAYLPWTKNDVLHMVQSMARSQSDKSCRQGGEIPLFPDIRRTEIFSLAQKEELASEALHFFSLAAGENSSGLQARLVGQPDLAAWAEMLFAQWDKTSICFHSSGSTGAPTRHCFPMDLLLEEIISAVPRYRSRQRIVSVMPVHHSYGMKYGPLLAKYLGVPLLLAPMLPSSAFFATLRPGDLVVAFPMFWRAVLTMHETGCAAAFPPGVEGMTATNPCPPEVLHSLLTPRQCGGRPLLAAITEIYGSSETSGIGMRCDAGEWYELFTCWQSVDSGDGARQIRRVHRDGRPVPLPDIVVWHDEKRFKPERRKDNAVQVGGINVYPEKNRGPDPFPPAGARLCRPADAPGGRNAPESLHRPRRAQRAGG